VDARGSIASHGASEPQFFIIEEDGLRKIERVAKRLYTENRMNGDEMRNAAQLLDGVVRVARQIPYEGS
jgi:hypothetical protein